MNRERVQELRNVIAGIPDARVRLERVFGNDHWISGLGVRTGAIKEPKPCGAVACMAGWAWLYPPFVKDGIRTLSETNDLSVCESVSAFFDVPRDTFDARDQYEFGTDKQIALRRLDELLAAD